MKVPVLEDLVQEVETNSYIETGLVKNLVTILLFLSNHKDSVVDSSTLWNLCDDEIFYSLVVKRYHKDYGSPPIVLTSIENKAIWVCHFDTISLRDAVGYLLSHPREPLISDYERD